MSLRKFFSGGDGATHAWIEAFIPNYGWLGFDPTNNIIATEHYEYLAKGRNYNECSAVKSVIIGKVEVNVTVDTVSLYKNYRFSKLLTNLKMPIDIKKT